MAKGDQKYKKRMMPYDREAANRGFSRGQLNALRHLWLVQKIGRPLADAREGNRSTNIPFLKGLLTSNDDPVDYWNNAVADKFLGGGTSIMNLHPRSSFSRGADSIQWFPRMRNPQYKWNITGK